MHFKVWLLAVIVILCGCAEVETLHKKNSQLPAPKLPLNIKRSTFSFFSQFQKDKNWLVLRTGTGFFISPTGCFLATYHQHARILQDSGQPVIWKYIESPAIPLKIMKEHDLVLFKLKDDFKYLPFLNLPMTFHKLQPREQVVIIAGISGPKILEADLIPQGYNEIYDRVTKGKTITMSGYRLWGEIQKGDSGSPIINSQGEAIGIVISTIYEQTTAIPISKELLFSEGEERRLCK